MNRDWHELVSQPRYEVRLSADVPLKARDGRRLFADIYRPDAEGKFPALLALSPYGKDMQRLPCPLGGPIDILRGTGGLEAGISDYFVTRGYVHVIADVGGIGDSEGGYTFFGKQEQEDGYDIVEWIAKQSWCNGNVGMVGMSYFAMIQYLVAAQQPPHLKAIFAHDGATDLYRHFCYHGGILNVGIHIDIWRILCTHMTQPLSKEEFSTAQLEEMVKELRKDEDIKGYPHLYMLTIAAEKNPLLFDLLMHPYDGPFYWERSAYTKYDRIRIPCYFLSRWTGWPSHLPGAFSGYLGVDGPKKLMIMTTAQEGGFGRPWFENHDIILRWYDHWLKGIDTGLMDEPPIQIFVQGINQWRYENEWPLARTKWTKLYLRGNGLLNENPPTLDEEPDSFTQIPWLEEGKESPSVQYTTAPLAEDFEVTGPIALYLYASLSTQDAHWMVDIKDVDTDGSEKLVTKGWLKASHREVDESKSKPYQPFHPHLRNLPVEPGRVYEYAIEIRETSNVFKTGHRIQLVIKGQDAPWQATPIRFHITNMRETKHTIHHTPEYPSHLVLPLIPR
jgi:predicted acyl esterase